MKATYRDIQVVAEGVSLRVRLRMVGLPEGVSVGSQFVDPETHRYIEDGPRAAPVDGGEVELRFEFPAIAGLHRVYVSPVDEIAGWHYAQGGPFLALDVAVEDGRAGLVRSRLLTLRRLRAEILLRSFWKAFRYPLSSFWSNRNLVRSMVWRDILARYRGSIGGALWAVLNPLLLMLTYYFVFGIVLRARFPGDPSRSGFVLYFLAGMLPWLAISEAAGRAPSILAEHRNLVKKVAFPVETLPVSLTLGGLTTQAFGLAAFLVLRAILRGMIPDTVIWLPLLIVPQLLLTLGVCWFLAGVGVYVRDLGHATGFLLTLWFFLTPICYPEDSLSPEALRVLSRNPLFVLVRGYRAILIESDAPAFGPLWKLWLVSAALFFIGHACFHKLRKNFADVI